MKVLILALSIISLNSFASSLAKGEVSVRALKDGTTLVSITGKAAEALYNTLSVIEPNSLGQKAGNNFTCTKFENKSSKKAKYSCDLSVDDKSGTIGAGAVG